MFITNFFKKFFKKNDVKKRMPDKPNFYVTRYLTGNRLDGFTVWRIERDYLCMYIVHFDEDMVVHLKLEEIRKATNSDILAVIESDMTYAYRIMYDDMHYTANTMVFVHDVTPEMIENELHDKSTWIVENEHFYKKADYPDGLPEDIKSGNAEEKSCD